MSTAIKANANSITATSQHSLRQLVRTQINEYSRLTQLLFTNLEILADGKTPPAQPNDIMKQIVQLDATLMGAVEKSMDKTKDHRSIVNLDEIINRIIFLRSTLVIFIL